MEFPKNRVEYEGGSRDFEDLELGFNIVKIGNALCNTGDPSKNKRGFDVAWSISFQDVNNSSKSTFYNITGNFDWEGDRISPKSFLLSKANNFFDIIGFDGGFNLNGEMEDENRRKISQEEFFERYVLSAKNIEIAVFVYRTEDDKYTNIHNKLRPANEMKFLERDVTHDIETGFLKMFDPNKTVTGMKRPQGSSVATSTPYSTTSTNKLRI